MKIINTLRLAPDPSSILASGTLPRAPGVYAVVLMTQAHIGQILALEKTIRDGMTEEQKKDIHPRDRAFFEKHFAEGHLALGLVHDGALVAQGLLILPTQQHPDMGGMRDMKIDSPPARTAILEGMLVHPGYRGNGIQGILVGLRLQLAHLHGRTDAVVETTAKNPHSWSVLLHEGFSLHSIGIDAEDGTVLYNLHASIRPLLRKRLKPGFNEKAMPKKAAHVPANDLERQKDLLSKGFRGVACDRKGDIIAFRKKRQRGPG